MKKVSAIALFLLLTQNLLFGLELWQPMPNEVMREFILSDLDNNRVSTLDIKGRPVILFFWATWCPHCRGELRKLNIMHAQLRRDGVEVFAINVEESADKVRRFTRDFSLSYRVLLDTDASVTNAYGVLGVPTYILINKERRIVFDSHYFPEKEYNALIPR